MFNMSEHIEALQEHLNRKGLTDMETQAHIGWLQQENAELRKDKARLDWLLSENMVKHSMCIVDLSGQWVCERAAIDKQMEESQ